MPPAAADSPKTAVSANFPSRRSAARVDDHGYAQVRRFNDADGSRHASQCGPPARHGGRSARGGPGPGGRRACHAGGHTGARSRRPVGLDFRRPRRTAGRTGGTALADVTDGTAIVHSGHGIADADRTHSRNGAPDAGGAVRGRPGALGERRTARVRTCHSRAGQAHDVQSAAGPRRLPAGDRHTDRQFARAVADRSPRPGCSRGPRWRNSSRGPRCGCRRRRTEVGVDHLGSKGGNPRSDAWPEDAVCLRRRAGRPFAAGGLGAVPDRRVGRGRRRRPPDAQDLASRRI